MFSAFKLSLCYGELLLGLFSIAVFFFQVREANVLHVLSYFACFGPISSYICMNNVGDGVKILVACVST